VNSTLNRIEVVLSRPEGALNVGAVCRAMKTMGLSGLTLVSPLPFSDDEVKRTAIHAWDVYENARHVDNLDEALAPSALSAGITRRRGVKRKWFSVLPEELASKSASMKDGITALVFGNERAGLSDDELGLCSIACHIPSSPQFPSLNLSHAVQIVASAFYRQSLKESVGTYSPVSRREVDNLVSVIHDSLDAMHYFKTAKRLYTDRFFRDILTRAALSIQESHHLEKLFRKLPYLKGRRRALMGIFMGKGRDIDP